MGTGLSVDSPFVLAYLHNWATTGFFLLTEASPSARGRHVRRNDHLYHLRNQSVGNGLRNGPRPDIVPVFSCDLLGIVGYLVWVSPVTRGADIHGNHA